MRRNVMVRALGAALASAALAMAAPTSAGAAAEAQGGWVLSPFGKPQPATWIQAAMPGRVDGRPGNWHTADVTVEGDDDWLTIEMTDWQCPRGVRPPWSMSEPTLCVRKDGKAIQDSYPHPTVTTGWLGQQFALRGSALDDVTPSRRVWLNLTVKAVDPVVTKTRGTHVVDGDAYEWLRAELTSSASTVSGQVGWVQLDAPGTIVVPHSYSIDNVTYLRGWGDGV